MEATQAPSCPHRTPEQQLRAFRRVAAFATECGSELAGKVRIDDLNDKMYVHCTELEALRLMYRYRWDKGANCYFDKKASAWLFYLEVEY